MFFVVDNDDCVAGTDFVKMLAHVVSFLVVVVLVAIPCLVVLYVIISGFAHRFSSSRHDDVRKSASFEVINYFGYMLVERSA